MDGYTGKRTAGGLGIAKKGPALSFGDSKHEDRRSRCDNRIGCNTRLKSMKGTQIGNPSPEKEKCSRSLRSSSSKAILGSSSKPFTCRSDLQKPHQEQQNQASVKKAVLAESSTAEANASEVSPLTTEVLTEYSQNEDTESAVHQKFSFNTEEEVGSSDRKQVCKRPGLQSREASFGSRSSVRNSLLSRSTSQVAKSPSPVQSSKAHRDGVRNLSCASVSNFHLSCISSSDSGHGRVVNTTEKRGANEESSSSKTKMTAGISTRGNSISQRKNAPSRSSLSFHEGSSSRQTSGKTKNWSASSDGGVTARTRRTSGVETRTRVPVHAKNNSSSLTEPVMPQQLPQTEDLVSESTPSSSSQSFSTEFQNSRPTSRSDDDSTHALHTLSVMDRDGFRRFNMDGIAEVLLALERIEQDADLTFEQLLALETNFLLGGLSLHDQHRDLRLDIDNMSYEELLALEEEMGTVSTALTEEALSKCLERSYYTPTSLFPGLAGCGDEDVTCSICQEEYKAGDELGKLGCEHGYHVECIHQWLRMKNWCPICKAAASPS